MPTDTPEKIIFHSLNMEATSLHNLICCECGDVIPAMEQHAALVMIDMDKAPPDMVSSGPVCPQGHEYPDACKRITPTCTRCHDLATAFHDAGVCVETGGLLSAYADWLIEQRKEIPHWLVEVMPDLVDRPEVFDVTKLQGAAWEIIKMNTGHFPNADQNGFNPSEVAKEAVANIIGLAYAIKTAPKSCKAGAVYFGSKDQALTILHE